MIESGSHTPGVNPASFRLPPNTALRYERPDNALVRFVADYHVLDSIVGKNASQSEMMLPNVPAIRIVLAEHRMALRVGERVFDPLPVAAFYGTTTRAAELFHGKGGVTIGINLTAVGFTRLFGADASKLCDRVVALDSLLAPAYVTGLVERLRASDQGPAVKAILDDFLRPLLSQPHRHEREIEQIAALLIKPGITNLRDAAADIGIERRQLERLTKRHFGYPPKLLLMRSRFLRSILAIKAAGSPHDFSHIDPAYCDQSHFTRDAKRFLGMPPAQFLKIPNHYLDAVLRARALVHRAGIAALNPVAPG